MTCKAEVYWGICRFCGALCLLAYKHRSLEFAKCTDCHRYGGDIALGTGEQSTPWELAHPDIAPVIFGPRA